MNPAPDVVIAGGGLVGAACAYYLSRAGVRVCLVERSFPASGTSRACDGLILHWDKGSAAELALALASANLWAELATVEQLSCEYTRRGSILVADTEAAWEAGRQKAGDLQAAGMAAEVLDGRGLLELEPNLAPDLAGGAFFPDDAQVDPRRATAALLDAARKWNLTVFRGAEVTAVRLTDGKVSGVRAGDQEIACGALVCAAGVWSNHVAGLAGLQLPVRPRKGHILVTGAMPGLIAHPLLEGSYAATVQASGADTQVALVAEMTAGGTVLLGSSREFAGFDDQVSISTMQAIARRALRYLPALRNANIIRCYTGLRPWSPDHMPLIGPVDQVPGLYLATGHEGAGIGLAPITGQLLTDWITGRSPSSLAQHVLPSRLFVPQHQSVHLPFEEECNGKESHDPG